LLPHDHGSHSDSERPNGQGNVREDVFDLSSLATFPHPPLLTSGDRSAPLVAPVIVRLVAALPTAEVRTSAGAGHIPHVTHAEVWVAAAVRFNSRRSA
jgi:pimeloyl-ACP methyl ester carboxylesterase